MGHRHCHCHRHRHCHCETMTVTATANATSTATVTVTATLTMPFTATVTIASTAQIWCLKLWIDICREHLGYKRPRRCPLLHNFSDAHGLHTGTPDAVRARDVGDADRRSGCNPHFIY